MNRSELSQQIKSHALALGFSGCGIAPAERLDRDSTQLGEWIAHKRHGQMKYMARNIAQRSDPRLILSGAKSVISLLHNYYPVKVDNRPGQYRVSKYAYGRDHHKVIGNKLDTLMAYIDDASSRVFARFYEYEGTIPAMQPTRPHPAADKPIAIHAILRALSDVVTSGITGDTGNGWELRAGMAIGSSMRSGIALV